MIVMSYKDIKLASLAKAQPQQLTLSELIENGRGDNVHVRLTGVQLFINATVINTQKVLGQEVSWTEVWIPGEPNDQERSGNQILG